MVLGISCIGILERGFIDSLPWADPLLGDGREETPSRKDGDK